MKMCSFIPAVYYHSIPEEDRTEPMNHERYPASLGITLELCAGIVDKKLPLEEIAREEILEECGYNVPVSCLEKVGTFR